jgi:hypothetical protein
MPKQREIEDLRQQLLDSRREFAFCLQQAASYGTTNLPFEIANRIHELREQIQSIKQALLVLGVSVDDEQSAIHEITMHTHDPWSILAERGIHFRLGTAYPQGWEYTLPMLEATWYGPYVSREEALRAALRHLFTLIQRGASTMPSATLTAATNYPSVSYEEQLKMLRRQLRALELARASQGVTSAPDLDPRIEAAVEQIEQIEQRMAETKEES